MDALNIAEMIPFFKRPIIKYFAPVAEKLAAFSVFNQTLKETSSYRDDIQAINQYILNTFNLKIMIDSTSIARIPNTGSVVLAAEHPTDALDHLIIMHVLDKKRSDYKFTANNDATKLKLWNRIIFPLAVNGEKNTASINTKAIKNAIAWLQEHHVLITYPGARPSTLSARIRHGREYWSALPILLAEKTGALILPVQLRLEEPLWQLWLKKHCRPIYNLLSFHVANSLKNTEARILIGQPLHYHDLPQDLTREQQAQWLKKQTESLR